MMNACETLRRPANRAMACAAVAAAVLGVALVPILHGPGNAQDRTNSNSARRIWFFFSPQAAESAIPAAEALKAAYLDALVGSKAFEVRPVLLVPDYESVRSVLDSDSFARLSQILTSMTGDGGVPLWDPEGIELAAKGGIDRVPALALEKQGRVHVIFGDRAKLDSLLKCSEGEK